MNRRNPHRRPDPPARRHRRRGARHPARPGRGAARGGHPAAGPGRRPRQRELVTRHCAPGKPIDDAIAVVVSTSGTTGTPKGAQLSAAALTVGAPRDPSPARRARTLAAGTAGPSHRGPAGPGPQRGGRHRSGGGERELRTGRAGCRGAALGPGRRYASLVSNQLDRALADPSATAALAELDAVLIGAVRCRPHCGTRPPPPGYRWCATYGMSETAGGCVYDGVPLDGVTNRIDGDAGGRIVLGGPVIASGYRNPVSPDPFAPNPAGSAPTTSARWTDGDADHSGPGRRCGEHGRADGAARWWRTRWPPTPPSPSARCSGYRMPGWVSASPRPWSSPPGGPHRIWPSCAHT